MSENLNKILGQLENDLRNLQSAKEQVENVIASNHEFASAANNLVTNTESLLARIEIVSEGSIGQFSQKLEQSKEAINIMVKESLERLDKNLDEMNQAHLTLQRSIEDKVNEVSTLAKDSIEQNLTNSLATIQDLSNLSKSVIDQQKSENLKTLNQLLETHIQIKQLIAQISALELPSTLKQLIDNLENQQLQNQAQFNKIRKSQTWAFIGMGLIVIVMLLLKYGSKIF